MITIGLGQQQVRSPRRAMACGHSRHVGTCPECQRAQLARWRAQLLAVQAESPRSSSTSATQTAA